jgi:hypothetical protein
LQRLKPTEMFCGSTSFMVAMADLRFIAALVLASLVLNSVEGRYNSLLELHGSRRELPRELSSAVAPPVDQYRQQLRLDNGLAATPPMGCGSSCTAHCIPFQFLFVVLALSLDDVINFISELLDCLEVHFSTLWNGFRSSFARCWKWNW